MRRVAALWMYTEFFMMTGILASSSAFRMHSSKNPAAADQRRPSLGPALPCLAPPLPRILVGLREKHVDPHPMGDQSRLLEGSELQAFSPTPTPRSNSQKEAAPRRYLQAGVWRRNSINIYEHLMHIRPGVGF